MTTLFGFGELKDLVATADSGGQLHHARSLKTVARKLQAAVAQIEPPVTLTSYRGRFRATAGLEDDQFPFEQEPYEEYLALVDLVAENGQGLEQEDAKMFLSVVASVPNSREWARVSKAAEQSPSGRIARADLMTRHLHVIRDGKVRGRLARLYLDLSARSG
jgi:hypothetical protein